MFKIGDKLWPKDYEDTPLARRVKQSNDPVIVSHYAACDCCLIVLFGVREYRINHLDWLIYRKKSLRNLPEWF